jgi:hypothetical protein
MIINTLLIAVTLLVTVSILVSSNWRWMVAGLAIQYLISFILIVQIWPLALASVKLISGWMGVVLLGISLVSSDYHSEIEKPVSERIFIFITLLLLWMVITATIPRLNEWLPISYTNLYIGLTMMASGLLQTSHKIDIVGILIGILSILIGFDIIYSSLEGSALVTAFYGLINIAICMLGIFIINTTNEKELS